MLGIEIARKINHLKARTRIVKTLEEVIMFDWHGSAAIKKMDFGYP